MIKALFFLSAAALFFTFFFHNVIEFNQDLGRHLLMGKIISETRTVPQTNLFSYTQPDFPFINSHWLSEVVFYQVTSRLGVASLVYGKTIVMVATLLLTLLTAYRFSRDLAATAAAMAILTPVLLERTEIRPEIFSFLFTAVFVYITFRLIKSEKVPRLLFMLLPLMEILWVNMHIYFVMGPILVAILLVQKFIESYCAEKNPAVVWQKIRPHLLLTAATGAAALLNPNGFAGAVYPLVVLNNYGYSIVENQSIFFLRGAIFNPNIFYFEIGLVTLTVCFLLVDRRRLTPFLLLLGALSVLAVVHIRSFPFFFLLEMPVLAYLLANINPGVKDYAGKRLARVVPIGMMPSAIVIAVIALSLFRAGRLISNEYYVSIDGHKRFGARIAESGKGAVDFVLANGLRGPIFNNFDVGSYLDYRLYPKEGVFVDGRPEAYPVQFFQNLYIPMEATAENFSKVDDQIKFNLIIVSHTDGTPWGQQFLANIIKNQRYQLVYIDGYAAVFVRKVTFPEVARRWAVTAENVGERTAVAGKNYLADLSLGSTCRIFGWTVAARTFFQKAYALNPESLSANQALGIIDSEDPDLAYLGAQFLKKYEEKASLILF